MPPIPKPPPPTTATGRTIGLVRPAWRRLKAGRFYALRGLRRLGLFRPRSPAFSATHDILTFVVVCKGRLEHLRRTLPKLERQPHTRTILVDARCPDGAAGWATANCPGVKVIRLDDQGAFNLCRARNVGLAACETPWVCFIDADVVLADDFAAQVAPDLRPGRFHRFAFFPDRYDLAGTCIVATDDARAIEGYDEVMVGWGGEDFDLYSRLVIRGVAQVVLDNSAIDTVIDHGDELRIAHTASKDLVFSQASTAVYRLAKVNLLSRATGGLLTVEDRRRLYDQAHETVRQALDAEDGIGRLRLDIPPGVHFAPVLGSIRQSVTIEFDASGG